MFCFHREQPWMYLCCTYYDEYKWANSLLNETKKSSMKRVYWQQAAALHFYLLRLSFKTTTTSRVVCAAAYCGLYSWYGCVQPSASQRNLQ